MLKIAICDDEQEFRRSVQRFLRQYQKKYHISFYTTEYGNGEQLLNMLDDSMDILFLDISIL